MVKLGNMRVSADPGSARTSRYSQRPESVGLVPELIIGCKGGTKEADRAAELLAKTAVVSAVPWFPLEICCADA
jgi:hypothetical protein